ncbi:Uma2 family endonuclease [Streptacidiphilus sp. EB129]|uniref:Uma2 family endonuclease n=1 Tax=Streptacidiphilus sp. EB129 TaxID=3156262 RepID=UPI003511BD52
MGNDGSLAAFWDTYDFPEEVRVEFIDGEIVMQANPMMLHNVPGRTFVRHVTTPFEAWMECGIEVGPEDKPKPDIVILRAGDWSDEMRDLPTELLLAVVEVVSTGRASIRRDYQDKYLKYQDCGIPVYVIIDPNIGKWMLFTLDGNKRYTETERGLFGDPIPFPEPLGFEIPTTAFHRYPGAQD